MLEGNIFRTADKLTHMNLVILHIHIYVVHIKSLVKYRIDCMWVCMDGTLNDIFSFLFSEFPAVDHAKKSIVFFWNDESVLKELLLLFWVQKHLFDARIN